MSSGSRAAVSRVPKRGWITRSLRTNRSGVRAMESATAATSGLVIAGSRTPS